MTNKDETLLDLFRSLGAFDKATAVFMGLGPAAMVFAAYQGIANHFYEATHTTLTEDNITYQLTGPSTVTQRKDGQTYTYDFQNSTVRVSDAAIEPDAVQAGQQIFQTYWASRLRDPASPSAESKPVDPLAAEQVRAAGCSIADHLAGLSREGAPLISPAYFRIQGHGRAFEANFCLKP